MSTDEGGSGTARPRPGPPGGDRERRPASEDGCFILGLVGRTGSGKTTVARALEAEGARIVEADLIGHEVTDRDPQVRAALLAEYGPGVYRADGSLDRARVASRVFQDPEARARLDAVVHPRLVERLRGRIGELRRLGPLGVVVLDAALLLEWGLHRECDAVLAVVATEAEQVRRQMAARGWTEAEARARLAVQRTNEEFAAAADAVLENRGSLATLEQEARAVVARLRNRRSPRQRAS